MSTILMHPPAGSNAAHIIPGTTRSYSAVTGTPVSVPDYDAAILEANGWFNAGATGTTAQRPTSPAVKQTYNDTTVGGQIFWDGKVWRHQTTGSAV